MSQRVFVAENAFAENGTNRKLVFVPIYLRPQNVVTMVTMHLKGACFPLCDPGLELPRLVASLFRACTEVTDSSEVFSPNLRIYGHFWTRPSFCPKTQKHRKLRPFRVIFHGHSDVLDNSCPKNRRFCSAYTRTKSRFACTSGRYISGIMCGPLSPYSHTEHNLRTP